LSVNLNFFIGKHGYGHHRRCLAVVNGLLKLNSEVRIILHTNQAKMETVMQWPDLSSLQYNPRISVDYTVMSSLPFYQASGFSGTLTDWEQQNIVLLTNIKGPVIIDNDAFLLKYFPTATLMGSFLWSEVIENPEHNAFTATEIQCLKEIHPRMLGLADMVMPGVHTQTAFTGLPWFCNQPPDLEKLTKKHPGILVTGGGSEKEQLQLLKTADAFMEKGFMVFSDAAMHLKARVGLNCLLTVHKTF